MRDTSIDIFAELAGKAWAKMAAEPQSQATVPIPRTLSSPQKFPPVPPQQNGSLPPLYRHPSGTTQLGTVNFASSAPTNARRPAEQQIKISPALGVPPGRDSGAGVLRIDQHGGGRGQFDYAKPIYSTQYTLGNPNIDANGKFNEDANILPVGSRAALLNPAGPAPVPPTFQNFPDAEAQYAAERLWDRRRSAAVDAVKAGPALPADANPRTLISSACNGDPNGCTPATYAKWLNAERGINAGYASQLAQLPSAWNLYGDDDRYAKQPAVAPDLVPTAPQLPPLNLNKVVMTPPGYIGVGSKDNFVRRAIGNTGSFETPYLIDNRRGDGSSAHEYRLTRGGEPMNKNHWTDTGVYTDARQAPIPFVGIGGEAKELGRHLGLSKELGGGDLNSYLDKIRDINNNPDATYLQKVRGNFARPVGSALQFGREIGGLGHDYMRQHWPKYLTKQNNAIDTSIDIFAELAGKAWAKSAKTFYHGSPNADLQTLRIGSYVTPDLYTAKLMGRFHTDTGKTWSDEDLAEAYKFGTQPKWKQGREPAGNPAIYKLRAAIKQLNLLDNPYEHTTLEELPVEKAWAKQAATPPQPADMNVGGSVSMPVTPQLPSLATPEMTNSGITGWIRNNYSGVSGLGQNRKNFFNQVQDHINPPQKSPGFLGSLFSPKQTPQPNLTPQYTQFLNKKNTELMGRVGVPYETRTPTTGGLLDSVVLTNRVGKRIFTLPNNPNNQYLGQGFILPKTPKEGPPIDLYKWGPAMPRALVGLHERQHLLQNLPSQAAQNAAGFKPADRLLSVMNGAPEGSFMEPAAVMTEMTHAADAAKQVTGKPVPGNMTFSPGYSMPIDEMRREGERAGVLSGQHTAQEALNTPAGQAWLRMQMQQHADAARFAEKRNEAAAVGAIDTSIDIFAELAGKAWAKSAKTFYHGSTTPDLATLKSTQPNMGGAGVYGADNIDWAALYALAKDRKGMAVIGGANPKLLIYKDNALLPEGNVYEYDSDKYSPPPESDPNLGWVVPNDVTPTKTHKVKLTDHMRNIEQFDDKDALRKRFAELAGKAWAKQAADPNQLVLVSGHSGSGKSTVAQNLATQLGVPKLEIDQHPDFRAFLSNDPHAEHLQRGTEEGGKFKALLQRIANETAQRAPGPAVIEGTQLAHLSPEALAGFPNRLYVSGTRGQVFKQRLERNKANYARKGKAWTPEVEAHKQEMAGKVYDFHAPEVAAYGQLPGTVSYNWHAKNRDAVIAAFRNKLKLDQAQKQADLLPGIQLQDHQQRIADRVAGPNPRMLVYHGLGSGKSLSALAAAEAAQKLDGGSYGIVAPASLKNNFQKEIKKFTNATPGSSPEVMSYTGLGMGKQFQDQPETLIMDEAARLRNPDSAMTRAAVQAAARAKRVMLLTGTPITNEPKDLASLISLLHGKQLSPEEFDKQYVGEETVKPNWSGWFQGAQPGVRPVMRNGPALRKLLEGHVDYQPSKTPEGVNVNEQTIRVPLSPEQDKIQKAIRTKVPPGFLWKIDHEFPMSREELSKLNSFMTGFRQVGLSTQPFRADRSPLRAFQQSAKMQEAFKNLKTTLDSDPRKKAIIYSNFVNAGLNPYSAGLTQAGISHGIFTGKESVKARQDAINAYNENKLRALLVGPAGAEGISTKGTSLIQLMDPHWNEARSQQAQGRGLRFDSHTDLPEELKNVAVQRYLSSSEDPSYLGKLMGYQRERTGDEVLSRLTAEKERLNEQFRQILRDAGTPTHTKASSAAPESVASPESVAEASVRAWYKLAAVAKPLKTKRRPSRKKPQTLSPSVTALGGVGLGGLGLAYGLGSDSHFKNLQDAVALEATPLGPDDTAMSRYSDILSRAASSTPFGMPVGEALTKARGSAGLMKLMKVGPNYVANTPGRQLESGYHYNSFRSGPIAAYHHMLTEARPDAVLSQPTQDYLKSVGQPATTYAGAFQPRFDKAFHDWKARESQPGGILEGSAGWLQPHHLNTSYASHEKQMEFLKQYEHSLPAELRADETTLFQDSLEQNKKNYMPITRAGISARNSLKNIGVTAAGGAAGGYLGHRLYNRVTRGRPQSAMGHALSTAAGVGLGGGASYLAGTQDGHNVLNKLQEAFAAYRAKR